MSPSATEVWNRPPQTEYKGTIPLHPNKALHTETLSKAGLASRLHSVLTAALGMPNSLGLVQHVIPLYLGKLRQRAVPGEAEAQSC